MHHYDALLDSKVTGVKAITLRDIPEAIAAKIQHQARDQHFEHVNQVIVKLHVQGREP